MQRKFLRAKRFVYALWKFVWPHNQPKNPPNQTQYSSHSNKCMCMRVPCMRTRALMGVIYNFPLVRASSNTQRMYSTRGDDGRCICVTLLVLPMCVCVLQASRVCTHTHEGIFVWRAGKCDEHTMTFKFRARACVVMCALGMRRSAEGGKRNFHSATSRFTLTHIQGHRMRVRRYL